MKPILLLTKILFFFNPILVFSLINRKNVVIRHNPKISWVDWNATLTVGSGQFAFNLDATGLQTFNNTNTLLHTLSDWGWHTLPLNSDIWPWDQFQWQYWYTNNPNITIPYPSSQLCNQENQTISCSFLQTNPSRWGLGQLSFRKVDGTIPNIEEFNNFNQILDLYTGMINSSFIYLGKYSYQVITTSCGLVNGMEGASNTIDGVAVRVQAPATSNLLVQLAFAAPSQNWNGSYNWSDTNHHTLLLETTTNRIYLRRQSNYDSYGVVCNFQNLTLNRHSEHIFWFQPKSDTYSIVCRFDKNSGRLQVPSFDEALSTSKQTWETFWESGAAIDLGNVLDPRAAELERRVIQSRYLMRAMEAGLLPPQETGLVVNSWYGFHHQEMRYWHHSHWAVWNRSDLLVPSDLWYIEGLENATSYARYQGYDGARWPKQVGAPNQDYVDTLPPSKTPAKFWSGPSTVSVMLIWEQPHPILMAELEINSCNKESQCIENTLNRLSDVVDATARFMASYSQVDGNGIYHLGIPLTCSEEHGEADGDDPEHVYDGTYEATYWSYGLTIANLWRERNGLIRNKTWDLIATNLATRPILKFNNTDVYNFHSGCTNPYQTVSNQYCPGPSNHPSMVAAHGVIPGVGYGIKSNIMNATYDAVIGTWDWDSTWGWDFPMLAMTAMRLGRNDDAMNVLLFNASKNIYLVQGWNEQKGSEQKLPLYMPGNGGLLTAVAMMAGGWDGIANSLRGFPLSWVPYIQAEGFIPYV